MRDDGYWKWQAKHPYSRPIIVRVSGDTVIFLGVDTETTQAEAEVKGRFIMKIEDLS